MTPANQDIRWQQRFQNFDRAFMLLRSALEDRPLEAYSPLEEEGIIQRFEYAYELAWKAMKDYLEANGVVIQPVTTREVIKQAFAAKLVDDGHAWIDMMLHPQPARAYLRLQQIPPSLGSGSGAILPCHGKAARMADDPGDANMNGMPSRCGLACLEVEQLTSVLRRYPQVRRAVLFGSRAKGTARANSDIDIALYGDLDDLTVERIALEMDELPMPYLFDVKAVATLKNPALLEHIQRVGMDIYP